MKKHGGRIAVFVKGKWRREIDVFHEGTRGVEASDFYPKKLLSQDRAQWHKNGLQHNPGVDTDMELASGTLASRSLGLHRRIE
jgi:hypothetical protein